MIKTSRIIYLIIGSGFTILIGALHMFAHFRYLITPAVNQHLQEGIDIFGEVAPMWNSWGVMSVMMGMSFIVIGLLNLYIFSRLPKDSKPPIAPLFIMIIYLISVVYVGSEFNALPQFYGGIFGIVLTSICILLCTKK